MQYLRFKHIEFLRKINTEEKACNLVWQSRFGGKNFICPYCRCEGFYQYRCHQKREVRKCKGCDKHVRLRAGNIFESSKVSMLTWMRAILFVMESKRGISALELKRKLGMKSYGTVWGLLQKIRVALRDRDKIYKLKNIVELDGTNFGRKMSGNQRRVLVAIETRPWIDENGKSKQRAGFARVEIANEERDPTLEFLKSAVEPKTKIQTDAGKAFLSLKDETDKYDFKSMVTDSKQEIIDAWLPWVHKFISNAKSWIIGTHHGVEAKYLELYLAEYTYRFNRRHDPDSLFHRALQACTSARPSHFGTLCG